MRRGLWVAFGASSAAALAVSVLPDPATETVTALPGGYSAPPDRDLDGARAAGSSVQTPARTPWPDADPAASRAWGPPMASRSVVTSTQPPLAAAAAAPAASAPPPFPYAWIGQMEIDSRMQIYLSSPQRLVVAFEGDVLDSRWRIDTVRPGRLQVTWLPTDTPVAVAAR